MASLLKDPEKTVYNLAQKFHRPEFRACGLLRFKRVGLGELIEVHKEVSMSKSRGADK